MMKRGSKRTDAIIEPVARRANEDCPVVRMPTGAGIGAGIGEEVHDLVVEIT